MPQQLLCPSPAVRASISNDGLVILDPRGGLVFSANQVGARIWQLLEEQRTLPDIAQHLSTEYAVPILRAHADTLNFVAALISRGLVREELRP